MKIKDAEMAGVETWQSILQKEFPFMQRDSKDDHNIYKNWGFECSGGWYQLLRECCESIVARYAEDSIGVEDIDFVPEQIKEKFGTLRFYYSYTDAPCEIVSNTSCRSSKKSCLKRVILEASGTLEKPQNSRSGFE